MNSNSVPAAVYQVFAVFFPTLAVQRTLPSHVVPRILIALGCPKGTLLPSERVSGFIQPPDG